VSTNLSILDKKYVTTILQTHVGQPPAICRDCKNLCTDYQGVARCVWFRVIFLVLWREFVRSKGLIMLFMRYCAWRTPMNPRLTVALGIAFGLATFAAASTHSPRSAEQNSSIRTELTKTAMLPTPLCPPSAPTCSAGGGK
jgi:hypothetical protein